MRNFVHKLEADVRGGQESWRVFAASSAIALIAAMLNVLAS